MFMDELEEMDNREQGRRASSRHRAPEIRQAKRCDAYVDADGIEPEEPKPIGRNELPDSRIRKRP
jgi:hypothetical protein